MLTDIDAGVAARLERVAGEAISTWSPSKQLAASSEELQELCLLRLSLICTRLGQGKRRPLDENHVREEIADCIIMLEQLSQLYFQSPATLSVWVSDKLKKLENKIAAVRREQAEQTL